MRRAALGFVMLLLATVNSVASEVESITKKLTSPPGLIALSVAVTDDVAVSWGTLHPATLDLYQVTSKGGRSIGVFYLDRGTAVIVSDAIYWEERRRKKIKWIITVGSSPEPDPDPIVPDPVVPRPEGFAGEVCDKARAVNKPAEAKRLAVAFQSAAAEVSALPHVSLRKIDEIISRYVSAADLSSAWVEFGGWIQLKTKQRVTTRSIAIEFLREVQAGLECAR